MHSPYATILGFLLATLMLLQTTIASPVAGVEARDWDRGGRKHQNRWGSPSHPSPVTPTLPQSGDATELPAPSGSLVAVAVGRGVQNYTCATTTSVPVALGAIATLYNATEYAYYNEKDVHTIPGKAVNDSVTARGYVLPPPYDHLPVLGKHFFGADGTPTFDLYTINRIMYGKKTGDIKAPADAPTGPQGAAAVDWLQLQAKPTPYTASQGINEVYRVETAGGSPPAVCSTAGVITVQYAAEYWFYF